MFSCVLFHSRADFLIFFIFSIKNTSKLFGGFIFYFYETSTFILQTPNTKFVF